MSFLEEVRVVKIILLGDGAVGKTSLRRRFLGKGFSSEYLMTIGADFAFSSIQINEATLNCQIWDLAGQPRFSGVRKAYYSGCFGGILVFDRTRPKTLDNTMLWLKDLWKDSGHGPIPFILLGNKSDLLNEENLQLDEKAKSWAEGISEEIFPTKGFRATFLKTSAKTGLNVNKAFEVLGNEILNYMHLHDL